MGWASIVLLLFLIIISFRLGRHWESYSIKNQLEVKNIAVSKWGEKDNTRIIIRGIVNNV